MKKILVPVDFSINSAEAMRKAVAISKQLDEPAQITALHNYEPPANYSAYRFNQTKLLAMIKEDREKALQHFLEEHVPEADRHTIEPCLLQHQHQRIGSNISSFAEKYNFDLIVMGAKGHSRVALLLMGSVTEKVLSLTKKVPVLVVK